MIKHFLVKFGFYTVLILLVLECLVRVLHLYKDTPERYIDEKGVEKWVPGQQGYSVTGNRKQNFSEYRINRSGYNSYREFTPKSDNYVIALIGDSFIEGFHQPYYNSIGKKMEKLRPGISVYEYGYAGYDLADELHLISAYGEDFQQIEKVVIYMKYPDDLKRGKHAVSTERMRLSTSFYPYLKRSKLVVYLQNIGLIGAISSKLRRLKTLSFFKPSVEKPEAETNYVDLYEKYLENFAQLCADHNYDKTKYLLLLDSRDYPPDFLGYLSDHNYNYIDYGKVFSRTDKPVTLIYDQHWNDHGRNLIAKQIVAELLSGFEAN